MVVFLSITTIGLGMSFKELARPGSLTDMDMTEIQSIDREIAFAGPESLSVIDLGCLDRKVAKERLTFEGTNFRFKGKFCNLTRQQLKHFGGLEIKNLSTGAQGTVFFQSGNSQFVSDALLLQEGKNLVQLQWKEAKQAETKTLLTEIFEK